jgi:hypothetical protein
MSAFIWKPVNVALPKPNRIGIQSPPMEIPFPGTKPALFPLVKKDIYWEGEVPWA